MTVIRGLLALRKASAGAESSAARLRLFGASVSGFVSTTDPLPLSHRLCGWFDLLLAQPIPQAVTGVRSFSGASSAAAQDVRWRENPQDVKLCPKDVVLYQYEACPFCNKVKAFLDYYKIPYKVVEVNPISKKEIKWSDYKKVPILKVDGKQMVNSSAIIDELFQQMHPSNLAEDEEESKWCRWVDNHLVHVLSPNIYRTPSEALESFNYITSHGNFSFTERLIAKYTGAAAMYMVSKKLKKRHNITDERGALYEAAETWVNALKNRPYCGGVKPNLADLSVFGVLRPVRNLKSGKDMVENTRIGEWYDRMEKAVGDSARVLS
ncbi:hypothetical protein SAY86_011365 [Trapa natans]|uniref:Prostaglandin E synthase 2 n=1 Tax=Trapa natans TaxID=22666 RepID=A0AAN7R2Q7_TRANT|nr:hypothetical protein SAY86_011365 [Trapa natans]